jgi:HAD superfamily hydrolase (TIGR01484 family)
MDSNFNDLFAFDLDGTLVHGLLSEKPAIPEDLRQSIFELSESAHIVVATGRRFRNTKHVLDRLPQMKYAVCNSGLVVKDIHGKTLYRREISRDEALRVASLMSEDPGIYPIFVCDSEDPALDYIFLKESLEKSPAAPVLHKRSHGFTRTINSLEDMNDFSDAALIEVATLGRHEDLLKLKKRLQAVLSDDFYIYVVKNTNVAGWGWLEVCKNLGGKWTGVSFVKEKLGVDRVISVGDDENDFVMLKSSDIGIAMAHAEPHILEVAHQSVDGPAGLSKYLREFYEES